MCTTGAAAIHIFKVRVRIYLMYNVLILLVSCCDSNILLFAQKVSVPVSPSIEICMHIICTGYGLRAMRVNDAYQFVDFFLFFFIERVLSWFFHAWGEK